MSKTRNEICHDLYGENQRLGLEDVTLSINPEFLNTQTSKDNDNQTLEILRSMVQPFEQYTKEFIQDKKEGEESARMKLASKCGCFLYNNDYITCNAFKQLPKKEQLKAIPYIPGDEVYTLGAFGIPSASHHGVYVGTNDCDKTGMVIEVDSLLDPSKPSILFDVLQMLVIGGVSGIIRIYRDLSRRPKEREDDNGGFFGVWLPPYGNDSRDKILQINHNKTTGNPNEVLDNTIKSLTCKFYEYSAIASSCEHFAKYISTYKYTSNQTGDAEKLFKLAFDVLKMAKGDEYNDEQLTCILYYICKIKQNVESRVVDYMIKASGVKGLDSFVLRENALKIGIYILQKFIYKKEYDATFFANIYVNPDKAVDIISKLKTQPIVDVENVHFGQLTRCDGDTCKLTSVEELFHLEVQQIESFGEKYNCGTISGFVNKFIQKEKESANKGGKKHKKSAKKMKKKRTKKTHKRKGKGKTVRKLNKSKAKKKRTRKRM
jgi:hypothetical protein